MGLFDRLFGKGKDTGPVDPDDLRTRLFDAAGAGDLKRVEQLCRAHRDLVVAQFPAWQKIPEPLRADQAALQRYGHGLVSVAQTFASRLGDVALLQRLIGPPQDNPLVRWQDRLGKAQALIEELDYPRAMTSLAEILAEVQGLQGSGADRLLPITLGRLAECHFHVGEAERSLPLFEQALLHCERTGDLEGAQAYLGSLYNVHRWLGRPGPAAEAARRLAEVLDAEGRPEEAAEHRRQAERVAAGEPASRVVAVVGDRTCELDEIDGSVTRVSFVFLRDRLTLRPASEWTRKGEERGSAGDHAEALEAFHRAAAADPHDPHSRYMAAFALLHLRRYAEAERLYDEVERLAPGWFHCRANRWLAGRLAAGAVDHETFRALHRLRAASSRPTGGSPSPNRRCVASPSCRCSTCTTRGRSPSSAAGSRPSPPCAEAWPPTPNPTRARACSSSSPASPTTSWSARPRYARPRPSPATSSRPRWPASCSAPGLDCPDHDLQRRRVLPRLCAQPRQAFNAVVRRPDTRRPSVGGDAASLPARCRVNRGASGSASAA